MSVKLSSLAGAGWQLFDNNGVPLTGGLLYTYAAGTTTPAVTYTSNSGSIPNSNPIVLDAAGRVTDEIWLVEGSVYKFVLNNSNSTQIWQKDNISGINDVTSQVASIYADFANTSDVTKGDALVGFKQSNSSGVLTGAVGLTVHQKFQEMVSILDFGADPTGITDSTTAIQAALNATSGTTFIPAGTYKITSPLVIPGSISVVGQGHNSVIQANSCHGITFAAGSVNGARRISDFTITGVTATDKAAIFCDLDSTPGGTGRVMGMLIENISISSFGTGVYGRGFWTSTFRSIWMISIYQGFVFVGQSAKVLIDDCTAICAGFSGTSLIPTYATVSTGLYAGTGDYAVRPEDLQVQRTYLYDFQYGINWRSVLYGGIIACDLDNCLEKGMTITSDDGGLAIRDNWIAMATAVSYVSIGIEFVALGYTPTQPIPVIVSNNRIGNTNTYGTTKVGISFGQNVQGVMLENNGILGFDYGIRADATKELKIIGNTIGDETISIFNTVNTYVSANYVAAQINSSNNTGLVFGPTYGPLTYGSNPGVSTYFVGQVTMPATLKTVTVTWGSLGISNLSSTLGYQITFFARGGASSSRGFVWGDYSIINLTVSVDNAFSIDSTIPFCVQAYAI